MSEQELGRREQFYDDELAPALMSLAEKCEANGMSIVAVVEWGSGNNGLTASIAEGASFDIRMVHAAAKAHGNIDSLCIAVARHARTHGHGSMVMKLMGVPQTPGAVQAGQEEEEK